MTTKTAFTSSRPRPTSNPTLRRGSQLRRIGITLLALLGILVAFIIALPVLLLFLVTTVPLVISVMLVLADIGLVIALLRLERTPAIIAATFGGIILVSIFAVWLSQTYATTPPITDADGNPIPDSIAVMETVNLNGTDQWITIRGHDVHKPVLLFLAGGPGGSELVMTRKYLSELEKHFIVVNWDQPGTGKSYHAVAIDTLTPERVVTDGYALTQHLRERFQQNKVYLLGESWGSILGVWLVQEYPELFHALVTTGQMVAPVENDIQMYEFAIERLSNQGQQNAIENLKHNGPPPYARGELVGHFMAINSVVNEYMDTHAHGEGTGHNLMLDSLGAQEYGLVDKVYWGLSLLNTFPQVYSQLNDMDLRTQATTLNVPVYFIKGHWDINASNPLMEEYFALLDAPYKELIWFENSAHVPLWEEPVHFVDVMVNTVLAQTQPNIALSGD